MEGTTYIRYIKQTLIEKFKGEGCGFGYNDITVKQYKHGWRIQIKDYKHITFDMHIEEDSYFGYIVWVDEIWSYEDTEDKRNIIFIDSKYDYQYRTALIRLGYHIANTF